MNANQIFFNFLQVTNPKLARSFKKKGEEIYETYLPLNKVGHKFVYDIKKQIITHIFFQTTFNGYEYGKKMATRAFDVISTNRGFKIKERI